MKRDEEKINNQSLGWKKRNGERISGITEENSKIILNYVSDMEYGLNIGRSSIN